MTGWRRRSQALKQEIYALYLAYRDPRTPWAARILAAAVVAYAFSPLDLIPDFVPVLGYLDDLVLVPLGIALALRLIPPDVLTDCRERAGTMTTRPTGRAAAAVIVLIWIGLAALAAMLIKKALAGWL